MHVEPECSRWLAYPWPHTMQSANHKVCPCTLLGGLTRVGLLASGGANCNPFTSRHHATRFCARSCQFISFNCMPPPSSYSYSWCLSGNPTETRKDQKWSTYIMHSEATSSRRLACPRLHTMQSANHKVCPFLCPSGRIATGRLAGLGRCKLQLPSRVGTMPTGFKTNLCKILPVYLILLHACTLQLQLQPVPVRQSQIRPEKIQNGTHTVCM
jgi:hypothetical protein